MENKLRIEPGFWFLAAMSLYVLPFRWIAGTVLAALFHELCHCVAVYICGGQVISFSLGAGGAGIETSPLFPGREALCALAGPLGSFSLLLISEYFPEAALCGLVQGAYNILPLYPMDGGRILKCLLPQPVCLGIQAFAMFLLSGLCIWIMTRNAAFGMILLLSLWIPVLQRKIACKGSAFAVQ